ncbi:hypothetical protein ABBQ38_013786 [Trebouxia sp. C0009 RCD-2024]
MDQEAVNPFLKSRTSVPTVPQCIWDVLKDHQEGLSISSIVEKLQQRSLRDFSGLKNPCGQVASNLGRHLDHFTKIGGRKRLWGLRVHEPAAVELDSATTTQDNKEPSVNAEEKELRVGGSQAAAARLPSSSSKRATRSSSSSATHLADAQLVGLACTLWWEGEQDWYPGVIKSWNPANSTYTVQYDDGDQETGAAFTRYSLEQSSAGAQTVKVHEFQPGNYMSQAEPVELSGAAPPIAAESSAQELYIHGAVDTSDEDVPLSTLAERHPAQPHRAAEAPQPQAENAAGLEAIHEVDNTPATAAAQPVVEAPATSKDTSGKHSQAADGAAAAEHSNHSEAGTSPAEATPVLASRGSPEPRPAPPAAVELRTTRSRSKRMSTDASPSVSIASKHSLQKEPEGKAALAGLPSGRRKRSITPAHPPPAAAAAAAAPHPAAAEAVAGMRPTAAVKAASGGMKRQRTPDTATAAPKKTSRRSSRLSAATLDQSEDPQPEDTQPIAAEAVLTAKHAAPADIPPGGGLQLNNAATVADDTEEHLEPTAAAAHTQASEVAAPAHATAVPDALDAAPAQPADSAVDATPAVADPLQQAIIQQVADVTHNQPESRVSHSMRASDEVLLQADDSAQADGHALDQGTLGIQPAAASNIAAGVCDSAPTACGKPPTYSNTDSSNTEGANAISAGDGSSGEGVAAEAHALSPIASTDDAPLAEALPSVPAAQSRDSQEAEAPPSDAAAAVAADPIGHASDAAQAADTGAGSALGKAQAPDIPVAAFLGDAAQPADTGLEPPSKSVTSAAEPMVVTKPDASPDTSSQHTAMSDADMSVAAATAAVTPASLAEPVAVTPKMSTVAAGASAVEAAEKRPAVPAAAPALAAQAEGGASAQAGPLAAAPPHEPMLRSAETAATAAAAAAHTTAALGVAGADAPPATAEALNTAAAADAASPTSTADPLTTAAADAAAAAPTTADAPTAAAAAAARTAAADIAPPITAASPPTAASPTTADVDAPPAAAAPPTTAAAPAAAAAPPTTAAAPAKLKPVSVPKPPQSSGSTRIGLPHRPSSLSKSLLGVAQQKAGSTHIRPVLSKGLTPAPKNDRGGQAPRRSPSDGSTGIFLLV